MSADKQIPTFESVEEMAQFWDTHSLDDYWDQLEPVDFELDARARRRYLVAVDPDLLQRLQKVAQARGLSTESLVNLFLEQHLQSLEG